MLERKRVDIGLTPGLFWLIVFLFFIWFAVYAGPGLYLIFEAVVASRQKLP